MIMLQKFTKRQGTTVEIVFIVIIIIITEKRLL